MGQFNEINTLKFWCQKVLPLVYDDSLSYYELLNKVVKKLNDLIENNKNLPQYIADLIQSYITSGAIGEVIHNILTDYMLNVKNPPQGLKPAVGDGSEDDTQAIQGCIDYAFENGGKAVYFPSGVYLTKPLFLKKGVSLFGFDPNTTRVVLKGGSTQPLLNGDSSENTIKGLTFDGNADIQVNNLDLIVMNGGKYIFDDLILKDGYKLLSLALNETCIVTNVVFDKAIEDGMYVTGNGAFLADNLIFNHVSVLSGNSIISVGVDNATITNVFSKATINNAIIIDSNECFISAKIVNSVNPVLDNGNNNTIDIKGIKSREVLSQGKVIKADSFEIDTIQPLIYREPTNVNEYFKSVPFKNGNQVYQVLVLGSTDLAQTIADIRQAISDSIINNQEKLNQLDEKLSLMINKEIQDRGDEGLRLENSIREETLNREQADLSLNEKIEQMSKVYLQVDEPLNVNNNTIWYAVNGQISGSGGISIGNGETSETAPNDATYWFDPIEESEE